MVERPPRTPRRPAREVIHGLELDDPYRWLEDGKSPQVREWTEAQNRYARSVLDKLPQREHFLQRLKRALAVTVFDCPAIRGTRVFFLRRDPGREQPVLVMRRLDDLDGEDEKVVLDPNEESSSGLVSLDWWYPSPDGRLLAYGYSQDGDEWSTLYVLDVDCGRRLADRIERARYSSIVWKRDNSGFYYTRYPFPGEVPPGEENYHSRVFYHALGDDPANDQLVFGAGRPMNEMRRVKMSSDGRYLLVTAYRGWHRSELFVREERRGSRFRPLVVRRDALYEAEILEDTVYALTNDEASRYRVVALRMDRQAAGWEEIIPESRDLVLRNFCLAGGRLVVHGLTDAVSRLLVYGLDGSLEREVELPEMGTVRWLVGEPHNPVVVFVFTSFTRPPGLYLLDLRDGSVRSWAGGNADAVSSWVEARRVFYHSRDGTRVPLFILHRRDLSPQGKCPVVLTGYGGFNIARTPEYNAAVLPWLEAGGVYALACLRGGSEYGEDWHRAGMRENKQNVFDDFIAAAEFLIEAGYTSPRHLGIYGRSNGGLLVGAAMTQRPDLFRAVVCGVPLLDMVRYHRFLIAKLWIPEYGSPEKPEELRWLYAYSPYHRVRPGERYPAVYLFTAESDTRVDPMHARKMAAALQFASASGLPVLLHVEQKAGHGAGKPLSKVIQEQADIWAFLAWQLDLPVG